MAQETYTYLIKFKVDSSQLPRVEGFLKKDLPLAVGTFDGKVKVATKSTKDFAARLWDLAKRAAMVAPIWMLVRNSMMAMINTIQEGAERILELDKALTKIAITMSYSSKNSSQLKREVADIVNKIGGELGVSAVDAARAFERFTTAGMDVEEATAGMAASARLATMFQGDMFETAETLAQVYKLLGHTLEPNLSVMDRYMLTADKIAKLDEKNIFTIKGLTDAYKNSIAEANKAGLTFDQLTSSIASLITAGLDGAEAGTALNSSLMLLRTNAGKLREFGIIIPPDASTFKAYEVIIGKINEFISLGQEAQAQNIIDEIFNIRSAKAPKALATMFSDWKRNLVGIGTEGGRNLQKINELQEIGNQKIKIALEGLDTQKKRFAELKTQISGDMWTGFIGGTEQAARNLEEINKLLELLRKPVKIPPIVITISRAVGGDVSVITDVVKNELTDIVNEKFPKAGEKVADTIGEKFRVGIATLKEAWNLILTGEQKDFAKEGKKKTPETKKPIISPPPEAPKPQVTSKLTEASKQNLIILSQEEELIRNQALGVSDVQIAREKLFNTIKNEATNYTVILALNNGNEESLAVQLELVKARQIYEYAIAGKWEEVAKLSANQEEIDKTINNLRKDRLSLTEKELALMKQMTSGLSSIIQSSLMEGFEGGDIIQSFGEGLRQEILKAFATQITTNILMPLFQPLIQGLSQVLSGVNIVAAHATGGATAATSVIQAHHLGGMDVAAQIRIALGLQTPGMAGWGNVFGAAGGAGATATGTAAGTTATAGTAAAGFASWIPVIGAAIAVAAIAYSVHASTKATEKSLKAQGIEITSGAKTGLGYAMGGVPGYLLAERYNQYAAKKMGENDIKFAKNVLYFGAAAALWNAIFGKSTAVKTQIQEMRIASKIDVTNKQLEYVNRNLVALKNAVETYILPTSAYFSEHPGSTIEDQFMLGSIRGI